MMARVPGYHILIETLLTPYMMEKCMDRYVKCYTADAGTHDLLSAYTKKLNAPRWFCAWEKVLRDSGYGRAHTEVLGAMVDKGIIAPNQDGRGASLDKQGNLVGVCLHWTHPKDRCRACEEEIAKSNRGRRAINLG